MSRLIFAENESLHAPHLIDLEVAQVLRRYVRAAVISPQRGTEAVTDLIDFPITRYPHSVLLGRVWQLHHDLTAFDAAYVALAEALDARLVTRDRALARAAKGLRIEVV